MPLNCDQCPDAQDGCRRADYALTADTLVALAGAALPGISLAAPILRTVAAGLRFADGCRNTAAEALFPLTCTAGGLSACLEMASRRRETDDFLRELLGREDP